MVVDETTGIPPSARQETPNSPERVSAGTPQASRPRYVIVVSRDQSDLWRHLRQMFTGVHGVEVVLDRRHRGRWPWTQSRGFEAREEDRRRSRPQAGFSHRSFVVVNPEDPPVA